VAYFLDNPDEAGWQHFFTECTSSHFGYVTSEEQWELLLLAYEEATSSHFVKVAGKKISFQPGNLTVFCFNNYLFVHE